MNEHDVAFHEPAPAGEAIVCACGERFVRPTKDQAEAAHLTHYRAVYGRVEVQKLRGLLPKKES